MRLIQNGRPVSPLLVLCRTYGIDVQDDVSPQELNDKLQQTWFKEGYLRYQIKGESPGSKDWELLCQLGCIYEECPATISDYEDQRVWNREGILLLGALRARVVSRLHYLTKVCSRFEFRMVYLLGGARPLDLVKESREVLCTPAELPFTEGWTPPEHMPTTEAEMMEFTWQQSRLPAHWQYELVNTPLQPKDPKNPEGEKRPPNTGDTVREWFTKHHLQPGVYIVLSNQPFVQYQELIVQRVLRECGGKGLKVYACGPESSLTLPLSAYLDNIAKQVFEELQGTRS